VDVDVVVPCERLRIVLVPPGFHSRGAPVERPDEAGWYSASPEPLTLALRGRPGVVIPAPPYTGTLDTRVLMINLRPVEAKYPVRSDTWPREVTMLVRRVWPSRPTFDSPFADFDQLRREMLRLLDTMSGDASGDVGAGVFPPMNITQDDDNFYLRAEVPRARRDRRSHRWRSGGRQPARGLAARRPGARSRSASGLTVR
jgi:hypothetical protein